MAFSIKFDRVKSGWSIVDKRGQKREAMQPDEQATEGVCLLFNLLSSLLFSLLASSYRHVASFTGKQVFSHVTPILLSLHFYVYIK